MSFLLTLAALALTAPLGAIAANSALLVAGSSGFWNYRHQSDVCHAFHALVRQGMDPDRIITMFYDDIANDPENPFPGQIFNQPTTDGQPGVDVYNGCRKSYTGSDVTASNFLNVLTGNASAMQGIGTGQVLPTDPDEDIFVAAFDHGGTGVFAMPTGPFLEATALNDALKQMHATGMYRRLVFYLESCESGSMFHGLLSSGLGIYAATAASPNESSWGTYCPPDDDMVNGQHVGSCLGDNFSVSWMENADASPGGETLHEQYVAVRDRVQDSHVSQYGDGSWLDRPIDQFEGGDLQNTCGTCAAPSYRPSPGTSDEPLAVFGQKRHQDGRAARPVYIGQKRMTKRRGIRQQDGRLDWLYRRYADGPTRVLGRQLIDEIESRAATDAFFHHLVAASERHRGTRSRPSTSSAARRRLTAIPEPSQIEECQRNGCCRSMYDIVAACQTAPRWTDHALQYTRAVVNLCADASRGRRVSRLHAAARRLCLPTPSDPLAAIES